ncbi:MAG: PD-(D/E)XK nuclease family protein, partial [Burkholderiales bacterium]
LAARGVAESECGAAAGRVAEALKRTLGDQRGQWLLGERREAKSEYRLSSMNATGRRDWVIDRTFLDDEGTRWIVDFKTSRHEGGDVEAFLDRERERYRGQLEGYAELLLRQSSNAHDSKGTNASALGAIRLGLYFPLLGGWREWNYCAAD